MLRWWSAMLRRDTRGFTLVELLIVIVIVALLSAIAVPIFLNQRSKAEDAATAQEVAQLAGVANGGVAGNWIAGVDPELGVNPNSTQGEVPADAADGFSDVTGIDFQAGLEGMQRVRVVSYAGSMVVDPETTRVFANVADAVFCVSKESPTGRIFGSTSEQARTGAEEIAGPVQEMEAHCVGPNVPPVCDPAPFVDGTSAINMPDGWAVPEPCDPEEPEIPEEPSTPTPSDSTTPTPTPSDSTTPTPTPSDSTTPTPTPSDSTTPTSPPPTSDPDCSNPTYAANNPGECPGGGGSGGGGSQPGPTCSDQEFADANPGKCPPPPDDPKYCDRDELIKLISGAEDADGNKAPDWSWRAGYERMFAWAKVHKLTSEEGTNYGDEDVKPLTNPAKGDWKELRRTVKRFLGGLTGRVLKKPLVVTNHGYNPDETPAWWSLTSTLKRGDVILVDPATKEPKARCACGNPLKTWKGTGTLQTEGDGGLIGPAPEITRNADNTWTVSIEDYTNGYIGRGGSNALRVSAPFCQNTETARFYSSYDGSYVAPPDARSTGYSTIMGLPGQPYSGSVTVNDCTGENERLIVSVYEFPQGVAPQTLTWWNITSATPSVLRDPADIAEYNYGSF